ncbi:MAG: tyrosine/phenylalanine carboxypeptidase domain-containing protein [Acidimicrobiia bacterium]
MSGADVYTETIKELSDRIVEAQRPIRVLSAIEGIERAAEAAIFVEVFEAFRTDGLDEEEAWSAAHRIYRGSLPELGPCTRDLGYGKGLVLTLLYVRLAIQSGKAHRIPLLFCEKVDLLAMGVLHQLEEEGLVDQPSFVPAPFNDLPALAVALSLGGFTAKLDWTRLESDYSGLI